MKKGNRREFGFTVIAGELKGRVIRSPDLGITRPPLTRLRKSIFDFLGPYLSEAAYLDLFSGTGSYLFEAVSRGARRAFGVEANEQLVDAINSQAERYGVADRLTCLCDDVFETIPVLLSGGHIFDIILMAPPQHKGYVDQTLGLLAKHPLGKPNSLVLCQHDSREIVRTDIPVFTIEQQRRYGNTTFTVLRFT